MLNDEIVRRDQQYVKAMYRKHGHINDNDEVFWEDDDEDFEEGQENADSRVGDIQEGILTGIQAWEEQRTSVLHVGEERARYVEIISLKTIKNNEN